LHGEWLPRTGGNAKLALAGKRRLRASRFLAADLTAGILPDVKVATLPSGSGAVRGGGGRRLDCLEVRGIYSTGLETRLYVRPESLTLPLAVLVASASR